MTVTDVPTPSSGDILVKVIAAAQNPADWRTAEVQKRNGAILGADFSGTVEALGPNVPAGIRTLGERVAGCVLGGYWPNGSFAEYLVVGAEVVIHIPDDWTFEDASQLGIAPLTAAQVLYGTLRFPTPFEPPLPTPTPLLVFGGATSVGQYVIQLAKLAGLYVITTASPRNFAFLESLGANKVFDYQDKNVSAKIKEWTSGKLNYAVDCISEPDKGTPKQISDALSDVGGSVAIILPYESPREGVNVTFTLVMDLLGKSFDVICPYTATPESVEYGKKTVKLVENIIAAGKVRPNPILNWPTGLSGVPDGLQYAKEGKVTAQKIVYRVT